MNNQNNNQHSDDDIDIKIVDDTPGVTGPESAMKYGESPEKMMR